MKRDAETRSVIRTLWAVAGGRGVFLLLAAAVLIAAVFARGGDTHTPAAPKLPDPKLYPPVAMAKVAAKDGWVRPRALITGRVTLVKREDDGDIHFVVVDEAENKVICEIIPRVADGERSPQSRRRGAGLGRGPVGWRAQVGRVAPRSRMEGPTVRTVLAFIAAALIGTLLAATVRPAGLNDFTHRLIVDDSGNWWRVYVPAKAEYIRLAEDGRAYRLHYADRAAIGFPTPGWTLYDGRTRETTVLSSQP